MVTKLSAARKSRWYQFLNILLVLGLMFSLLSFQDRAVAHAGEEVNLNLVLTAAVPTPQTPTGTITDPTPTYTWTKLSGAALYRYALYQGTTLKYALTVNPTTCGSSSTTCSNTPATVLSNGAYTWKVRAYMGGVWNAYSANKSFTVASSAFVSQFTSDASGWIPQNGSWSVASGFYQTPGLANKYVSSRHKYNYDTFTYQVKLSRTGCANCPYGLYFNGAPLPLGSNGSWNNGYYFFIADTGRYHIGKYDGGVWHSLVDWTPSALISTSSNILKVTYNSSTHYVQFFINGTRVIYGYYSGFTSGMVGVIIYQDASVGNRLFVDYAVLALSAPGAPGAKPGGDALGGIFIDDTVQVGGTGSPDMSSP
ncbi:MAG: hypothetical protein A2X27_14890 [Chloroflexi bacterium GWD2_49_16]|nr:MAG: hypothetical protein A2X27_14890 [Chloroflexi bacterium GWD2_49_16]